MSRTVMLAGALALLALPSIASAQTTLVGGLGGPAGFGTNVVPASDDGTLMIDLTPGFPSGIDFYGENYTSLYVNMNGLVTFDGPQSSYADFAFPGLLRRSIGVYYADVDTTRGMQPGDPTGANAVYWHLSGGRLVVTWYLVGYAPNRVEMRNSFQIIISQRAALPAGQVQVELRYNQCEWAGAVAPRSPTPGIAGVDRGDRATFFKFNGSGEFTVAADLCGGSNVGTSGVWRFNTDVFPTPSCGNRLVETGEQCDDGNAIMFDGCHMCRRVIAELDASGQPDGANRDGGPRDASADDDGGGVGPGIDGGGGSGGDGGGTGGDGDGGGGGGGMDGGGGGAGLTGRDVYGGGCAAQGPGTHVWTALGLLALALLARRRR